MSISQTALGLARPLELALVVDVHARRVVGDLDLRVQRELTGDRHALGVAALEGDRHVEVVLVGDAAFDGVVTRARARQVGGEAAVGIGLGLPLGALVADRQVGRTPAAGDVAIDLVVAGAGGHEDREGEQDLAEFAHGGPTDSTCRAGRPGPAIGARSRQFGHGRPADRCGTPRANRTDRCGLHHAPARDRGRPR